MDSHLAAPANDMITVRSEDTCKEPALVLNAAAARRTRRLRRSILARPLGVQFRNDYKLFRVR